LGASNLIRDETGEEPSGSSTHLVCFEELWRVLLILVVLINHSDPAARAQRRYFAPSRVLIAFADEDFPQNAMVSRKVDENISKVGVKGVLPVGCIPLWGREGAPFIVAAESKLVTGKRISAKHKN